MLPSSDCCKVIIRSRHARTPWEKLCKLVVGDPVHMDIVLAKPQSSSARFCFSSYVNQEFEMCLMDRGLLFDESMANQCLDVTEEEYERCMAFVQCLVDRKTKYDYVDALVLMPMAPKVFFGYNLLLHLCSHCNFFFACAGKECHGVFGSAQGDCDGRIKGWR